MGYISYNNTIIIYIILVLLFHNCTFIILDSDSAFLILYLFNLFMNMYLVIVTKVTLFDGMSLCFITLN